jgi:hypothetical protein
MYMYPNKQTYHHVFAKKHENIAHDSIQIHYLQYILPVQEAKSNNVSLNKRLEPNLISLLVVPFFSLDNKEIQHTE